ncbi:MAG: hypothetical protein AB7L84_16250 [Acidimicrobiia bacterium]
MTVTPAVVGPAITNGAPASTNYVAALPRAAVADEVIVVGISNNQDCATPSGYTNQSHAGTNTFSRLVTKVAAGGETSVTVVLPGLYDQPVVYAWILTGVDPADVVAAVATPAVVDNATTASHAVTNDAANQRAILFQAAKGYTGTAPTASTPATWEDEGDQAAAYGYVMASAATKDLASSVGAQPVTVDFTDPATGNYLLEAHLHLIVFNPAPDVGGGGGGGASAVDLGVAVDWSVSVAVSGTGGSGGAGGEDAPTQVLGDCQIGFRRVHDASINLSGGSGVAQDEFELGDQCLISVAFVDRNDSSQPKDPTQVKLRLKRGPDASPEVYVYGVDAALTRNGPGDYQLDTRIDRVGTWHVRAEGTGDVVAANLRSFTVPTDPFYTDGVLV